MPNFETTGDRPLVKLGRTSEGELMGLLDRARDAARQAQRKIEDSGAADRARDADRQAQERVEESGALDKARDAARRAGARVNTDSASQRPTGATEPTRPDRSDRPPPSEQVEDAGAPEPPPGAASRD